jgi:regulator of cell morphogenesis and NO signaling
LLESDLDGPATSDGKDWSKATLTELSNHIEQTHHNYLKRELPRLRMMVRKVAAVHGSHSPWLLDLQSTFEGFANEMEQHTMKEEQVLFPLIRGLEGGPSGPNGRYAGGVLGPIQVMEAEHEQAGAALAKMRKISNDYVPPMEACNTFRATLAGLEELEAETHRHVHKENSILFPRAAELEASQRK